MSSSSNTTESTGGRPVASLPRRLLLGTISLVAAAAIWLPCVHLLFRPPAAPSPAEGEVEPLAGQLAARQLYLWTDPEMRQEVLAGMRATNAEWDFMGRTFLVLALANRGLRHPEQKPACLEVIDRIVNETLRLERERGMYHFLMPYARSRPFVAQPPRSLFVDGEIAMMLAARRLVEEKPAYEEPLRRRVEEIVGRMEAGPVLCAESYPDECWTFCNTVALAAVRMADRLDGTDHAPLFDRWLRTAREKLVDRRTGILISSFTWDGRPLDGPEGSSIWMAAHCLQLIDEDFAADQYRRAKSELGRSLLGFGYAREWPDAWQGPWDVDSGPVVPILGASAGSSGLALLGARAFDDSVYFRQLRTSLDMAAFPQARDGRLRYCASNQVGDAVLLYAAEMGPLWEKVREEQQEASK